MSHLSFLPLNPLKGTFFTNNNCTLKEVIAPFRGAGVRNTTVNYFHYFLTVKKSVLFLNKFIQSFYALHHRPHCVIIDFPGVTHVCPNGFTFSR